MTSTEPSLFDDEWLDCKEAARVLRVSVSTLERWRMNGGGWSPPYVKAGPGKRSKVLYRRGDLEAWLKQFSKTSTSDKGIR